MNDYTKNQIGYYNELPDKTADSAKQPVIIQQITVRPINRTPQDIIKWRNATRSAESMIPRRVLLYDLYADVILDGQVIADMGKRMDAVKNANWQFVDKDGKPVEEINQLIDSLGFEDLICEILNSKFWGYTMGVCQVAKNSEDEYELLFTLVERKNMRPEMGLVCYEQTGDEGINIREGYYTGEILEAGNPKDLGLLLSAAQYAIYKRGGLGDFATFVEVFGQGIIDATWDGFDEKQRKALSDSLMNIGNGGVLIRPNGTDVKMLENKTNSDGKLHSALIEILNAEISKGLLGTTETSQSSNSSGYAQSQTHQEDDDDKGSGDIKFVRRILNSRSRKILRAQGLDTKGGKFIVAPKQPKETTKDKLEVLDGAKNKLGMPIDHDEAYENLNIKKPDNYEVQIAEQQAEKEAIAQNKPADTPIGSGKKGTENEPLNGKQPGKLAKLRDLINSYNHFFG